MTRTVYSFAFAYKKARGSELLPREVCSCGCGRTFTRDDRVCMFRDKSTGQERVYASRQCLYEHVATTGEKSR